MTLNRPTSTEEIIDLYRKYQEEIHGDNPFDITRQSFEQSLCDSPLRDDTGEFGTFHIQYHLSNRLIGVSVIDVLPLALSSVYFFYNPEYAHLSLGTISVLLEIQLTKQLQHRHPDLRYYYLGYYLSSCPKLAYKARFQPSELLDPTTLKWYTMSSNNHSHHYHHPNDYNRNNTNNNKNDE